MALKTQVGRGTVVAIGGITGLVSGTEVFTPIAKCDKAGFTGSAWGTVDDTNFDSGVDDEFLSTTRNNGEVGLEGADLPDDPGQIALLAAYNDGLKRDFTVTTLAQPGYSKGKVYSFSALVTKMDNNIEVRAQLKFMSSLKVSGPVTRTPPVLIPAGS